MFQKRGVITLERGAVDEERLIEVALDAGADDVADQEEYFEVTTPPEAFDAVKRRLEESGIAVVEAAVKMVPQNTVSITGSAAEQLLRLLDELEDHDDVQDVAANFDIPPEELERLSAA
jgi:transcriptional/translational regulatory protein YebC/TACO1